MAEHAYVALLRGINVGGKSIVPMGQLKTTFEQLGFSGVKTYINSGNVIFVSSTGTKDELQQRIEVAIEQDFGFAVPVVLRDRDEMKRLLEALPESWVNDVKTKCDVMFLWPELDRPQILEQIPHRPEIEDVVYYPGAVVWRVDRNQVNRGQVLRIIGTDVYKRVTIRNVNTVRKLYVLMQDM